VIFLPSIIYLDGNAPRSGEDPDPPKGIAPAMNRIKAMRAKARPALPSLLLMVCHVRCMVY
jgi:hypothetical protein